MGKKIPALTETVPAEIDALYAELLRHFYDEGNRSAAAKVGSRLQEMLADSPEFADSIRGEEVRSLIAELHGDYAEAIRSREAEIRKILELHTLAVNSPNWAYVSRQYDFSDVSDRLDLLAALYDRVGDTERAMATLRESQQYCAAHRIRFDGREMLDEMARGRNGRGANGSVSRKASREAKPVRQA
jgi:hypothetical protein